MRTANSRIIAVVMLMTREIFLFSPIAHNKMHIMYLTTATCFGLFYSPSSGYTLHKTEVRTPRNITCELANLHACVLCNVLPDYGL